MRLEADLIWLAAEPSRPWGRVLVAMAAAAVLVLFAGRVAVTPQFAPSADELLETDALMSPALVVDVGEPCSRLPSGVGFQCTQVLASR